MSSLGSTLRWPESLSVLSGISFCETPSYFPRLPTQEEFDNAMIDPIIRQSSDYPGRLPVFQEITANSHLPTQEELDHAMIDAFIWESSSYPEGLPFFQEFTAYCHLPTQEEFDNAMTGQFIRECADCPGRLPVFREITANSHLPAQEELVTDTFNSMIWLTSSPGRSLPLSPGIAASSHRPTEQEFDNDTVNDMIWPTLSSESFLPSSPELAANYGYRNSTENCRCRGHCRLCHSPSPTEIETMEDDDALKELEIEVVYLLRSKASRTVYISVLPRLYLSMYRKPIRAAGYLPESQRRGRTGINLTTLLSRFQKSIKIIKRPHGQHELMLLEDYNQYMESRNHKPQHILFTFPDDIFPDADKVAEYFEKFGRVLEVTITGRNFGYVRFGSPEKVKEEILTCQDIHYICGFPVWVEPYSDEPRPPYGDYINAGRGNLGRDEASISHSHETTLGLNSNLYDNESEYSPIEGHESSSSDITEEDNSGRYCSPRYLPAWIT